MYDIYMRIKKLTLFVLILTVLALSASLFFACGKVPEAVNPEEGRVVPVSTAASAVYASMVAADGSKGVNYFSLVCKGSYVADEKTYSFDFKGAFDITEINREDDKRSQLFFEVKQGAADVFRLYYSEGDLYLDFPPYATEARIKDYNLAQAVYEIYNSKKSGALQEIADSLPSVASRVFTSCRVYSEEGAERYAFTLSYSELINSFSSVVSSWNAGFTPAELFAALHLTEEKTQAIAQSEASTVLSFVVKNGAFLSAKAETNGKSLLTIDEFALTSGTAALAMPADLGSFASFDFGNFSLSGTLNLSALPESEERSAHYGVTVARDFSAVTYPFRYVFKSNYVAGSGYEFSLSLTDKNGKASFFQVKGDYLYADLSAYGIQKCRIKTSDLSEKLGTTGFKDTDEFTFEDKLRMIALLSAARREEENAVTYELGEDFCSLLSEKMGFQGLFGLSGVTLGVTKGSNKLQSLSASLSVGSMTASLTASLIENGSVFGAPVEIPALDDSLYYDLSTRDLTHIHAEGTLSAPASFESDGACLSAFLSALSGESLTFEADGSIDYSAEVLFGGTGNLKRFFLSLKSGRNEIVTLYYTEDSEDSFYLIYPEKNGSRALRTFAFAQSPLAAFNEFFPESVGELGNKVFLSARDNSFTIGVSTPMLSFIEEKLKLLYPDLSLCYLTDLNCRRYDLVITDSVLTGKIFFDSDGADVMRITAKNLAVTFGDNWDTVSLVAKDLPQKVFILTDNNMPESATVTFTGNQTYEVSLKDYATGNKIWRYAGAPYHVGVAGQEIEVTATATLFAKQITAKVKVDISPVTMAELSGSQSYNDKYDVNAKTFNFTLYNDASPATVLGTFKYLSLKVGEEDSLSAKEISSWDLSTVTTALNKKDFTVKPKVKTYFGNEIDLGEAANFTVHIEGEKVDLTSETPTDYTITFVAYDGKDPLDPAVYSSALNVFTKDGKWITVQRIEWDLTNKNIEDKAKAGTLYAYSTPDRSNPDRVKAKVFDLTGNYEVVSVKVYFESRRVENVSFDTSSLDGVSYKDGAFTFDVLKVRSLDPTRVDGVLPLRFVANKGNASEFVVEGAKWEFDRVDNVLNASGQSGTLKLIIGDDISGHQTLRFDYAFTQAEVQKTALLAEDHSVILEKSENLYSYSFEHLNAYTYLFPKYVRVTYRDGEGSAYEDLEVKWTYDKSYREEDLCQGGAYLLTGAVGSEPLTVSLSFDQKRITAYKFGDDPTSESGKPLVITTKNGVSCLTYSVLAALGDGSAPIYASEADYPAKMFVAFNDEENYVETDITWDLSEFIGKADMIGNGFFGTVPVTAKGQIVEVSVFILPAVGDYDNSVYVDEGRTQQAISFRLMKASGEGYEVIDPRDVTNYPTNLYIHNDATGADYEVPVSWEGLEGVTKLYTTELAAGKDANEVTGKVVIQAIIGNEKVGFRKIPVEVEVKESAIANVEVSGIPLAATSEQTGGATLNAITPSYEEGATDSFSYKLSLGINPYYVNPKSSSSYPAYVEFVLDGTPVRAKASWDLTRIPQNAAVDQQSATYLVYAMIDLTSAFPNVRIPVAVNVLKREIDKVWINGSSQTYIDIDGYAAEPFGSNVHGDEVTLEVKVQFKGDPNRYPLELKYSKAGVILSYDGSKMYENITVQVGNSNGGYQQIGGYTIRVISNVVSMIDLLEEDKAADHKSDIFFKATYKSLGSEELVYTYQHVMDMAKPLPNELSVAFGIGGTPVSVYRYGSPSAPQGGVVFKWDRNEEGYIGVVLWNPAVDDVVGGEKQAVWNPEQSDYNTPAVEMFFTDSVWSKVYRDEADEEGAITVGSLLAEYGEEILTEDVPAANQRRYITADVADGAAKAAGEVLHVGTYRLYVDVVGHTHYKGKVYKTFTITRKDISDKVILVVNESWQTEAVPERPYTGNAYTLSAALGEISETDATKIIPYPVSVALLLAGEAEQLPVDVLYEDGNVVAYSYVVTVDESESDYTVTSKTLYFKIREVPIPNMKENVSVYLEWERTKENTFDVDVMVNGVYISDTDLTNGYSIKYYEQEGDLEEVTSLTDDVKYFYVVEIKVKNYTKAVVTGKSTARR